MAIIIVIQAILIAVLMVQNIKNQFKVGYYQQKLVLIGANDSVKNKGLLEILKS